MSFKRRRSSSLNPNDIPHRSEYPTTQRLANRELREAFEEIGRVGYFDSLEASERCDPEIFVHGVGEIHLPLSDVQARQLIDKSHQTPQGNGGDIIVDTSMQNSGELNPSQFKIGGATWQIYLNTLLSVVEEQLDITALITAKLCKLLIYEEGVMFKDPTDAEKIPGMFGTLAICLPSPHAGGDVVVKHSGPGKTLQTSNANTSFLFLCSDTPYEVLPLTTGYRWVLTYNLAVDLAAELPITVGSFETPRLREAFRLWSEAVERNSIGSSPRYWALGHQYIDEDLSYLALERVDRRYIDSLQKICADLGFDLFLAAVEKKVAGPYVDDGEEDDHFHALESITTERYCSRYIFDLSGNLIAGNVPLDSHDILDEKGRFEGRLDQEVYEPFKSNGPEATHWYISCALVIVPSKGIAPLLAPFAGREKRCDAEKLCDFFIAEHIHLPENEQSLVRLHELPLLNLSGGLLQWEKPLTGNALLKVLQVSIRNYRNKPELLQAILWHKKPLPIEFFVWIKEEYDVSAISIEDFKKLFSDAFNLQPTFCQFFEIVQAISRDADMTVEMQEVVDTALDDCIVNFRGWDNVQEIEGPALFDLSLRCGGFTHLQDVVIPIVERHSSHTSFTFSFLKTLRESMECGQLSQGKALYESVARKALHNMDFASIRSSDSRKGTAVTTSHFSSSKPRQQTEFMTYDSMLEFVSGLITFRLEEHLKLFGKTMHKQASKIRTWELCRFWIPFLKELLPVLKQHETSLPAPHWTQIYKSILEAYLLNYVGILPPEPSLSRQRVPCSCNDCDSLNQFLADHHQGVGSFLIIEQRRKHLQRCLSSARIDCVTETKGIKYPRTLVVRKTTEQHEADILAWRERRRDAEELLAAFDQEMLRTVLADQFDAITSMTLLECEQPSAPSTSEGEEARMERLEAEKDELHMELERELTHRKKLSKRIRKLHEESAKSKERLGAKLAELDTLEAGVENGLPSTPTSGRPSTMPSLRPHTPVHTPPELATTPRDRLPRSLMIEASQTRARNGGSKSRSASMGTGASRQTPSAGGSYGDADIDSMSSRASTTTTAVSPADGRRRKRIKVEVVDLTDGY